MSKFYKRTIKDGEQAASDLPEKLAKKMIEFVYSCKTRGAYPKPHQTIKFFFKSHSLLLRPISYCSFIYTLFDQNNCTITRGALNKSYEILASRSHNYMGPVYIFKHYKSDWKDCNIEALSNNEEPQEEAQEEPKQEPLVFDQYEIKILLNQVEHLISLQKEQAEKIQYLSSIIIASSQKKTEGKLHFSIDEDQMIEYILKSNKINLTFDQGE